MANRRNQKEIADGYENVSPDSQTSDQSMDLESARADGSSASTSLGATAQSTSSVTRPTIGRRIQTSDGKEYAVDDKESLYEKIDRRDIPEHNACLVNVLPNPALPGYENIPPASSKVGKFVKHPEFRSDDNRRESYSGYPLTNPSPRALVNAGMFYSGKCLEFILLRKKDTLALI